MAVRSCARVIVLLVVIFPASNFIAGADTSHREEWVVKILGGSQVASLLAAQSGYKYHGPVLGFKDTYIWLKNDNPSQKKRGSLRLTKALNANSKIIWADQQRTLERYKRDYISLADLEFEKPLMREKSLQLNAYESASNAEKENYGYRTRMFNDELWDHQWYLGKPWMSELALPKIDLNVLPLYRRGITGHGIRIAVVDDGLEYTHDDLRNNYDPSISYDVNEGDDDPLPRYNGENSHGTRCAGEIAMEANNRKCGVGIAFDASIGGIKLLGGSVTDRMEGEALGYKPELIDIYSVSWGPRDNGKTLDGPGRLAAEALERGVTEGRNGKGSIYVWASGNGGFESDDCGCDGYVGSIYTVAIASATQTGKVPYYGEKCSAILATTYSSGANFDEKIVTTNLLNTCTITHTGTSASAPLAAGIVALALQVNGDLTWRDIQHLIAWTSEYNPLSNNSGWITNAAGFWYNTHFGFGLMNAYALVMASSDWISVPEKTICKVVDNEHIRARLAYGETTKLRFDTGNVCRTPGSEIMFLEHVEVEVNLKYSRRGALEMHLISPSGTIIQILNPRKQDNSTSGFRKWKFMSVATWGEDPQGTWTLLIRDTVGPEQNTGIIGPFTLILHGITQMPAYCKNEQEICKTYDMKQSGINSAPNKY